MSEIKLLPCPFCQAELRRWDYMEEMFFEHPYNGCILSGKKVVDCEHDVKAWNTRKPMERIIERLEEREKAESERYHKAMDLGGFPCVYDKTELYLERTQTFEKAIEICKEDGGIE